MPVFNQSTGTFNSVAPAQAAGIAAPQAPPPALLPAAIQQSNQLRPIGGGQQSHPPVMPKPISIGKSLIGGSEEEEPEPSLKPVQPVQPGQNNLLPAGYTAITLPNGQPGYEINGRQYTEYGNPVSALPQQIAYTPPPQNQNQQSAYHQTPIDYQQFGSGATVNLQPDRTYTVNTVINGTQWNFKGTLPTTVKLDNQAQINNVAIGTAWGAYYSTYQANNPQKLSQSGASIYINMDNPSESTYTPSAAGLQSAVQSKGSVGTLLPPGYRLVQTGTVDGEPQYTPEPVTNAGYAYPKPAYASNEAASVPLMTALQNQQQSSSLLLPLSEPQLESITGRQQPQTLQPYSDQISTPQLPLATSLGSALLASTLPFESVGNYAEPGIYNYLNNPKTELQNAAEYEYLQALANEQQNNTAGLNFNMIPISAAAIPGYLQNLGATANRFLGKEYTYFTGKPYTQYIPYNPTGKIISENLAQGPQNFAKYVNALPTVPANSPYAGILAPYSALRENAQLANIASNYLSGAASNVANPKTTLPQYLESVAALGSAGLLPEAAGGYGLISTGLNTGINALTGRPLATNAPQAYGFGLATAPFLEGANLLTESLGTPIGQTLSRFTEAGPTRTLATEAALARLAASSGIQGALGLGINYAAGSPLQPYQAAALGASLPFLEEYAGSASKLLGLGFDKLTNPSGTIIGYELPADSPVYTEVETPTGNMRIYRGTTQEIQPLSDLQQQVRDSITAPTESGYAAGIHLTLAKDFVDDLENGESVIVSSPSEQAKGFRNLFTHPEYENPLYLAPSQLENGANVRQAYGGYVGLSDAAESGGKLVEGTPGQYSGVEIRLTKDNVLLPDDYAEMTGTQKELANLQNRVAKGKLSDSLTQQMQDYYNQYADYARSQGKAAIVAPENVWLPSGETQLVVQAGAVLERGGEPYNVYTIGPNKGRFQNIPILENTAPSVIQGHIVPAEVRAVLPYATEEAAQEAQIKPIPTLSPEQSIAGQTPEIPQTVMMAPAESSISSPMQSIASQQYNLYLRNSGLVSPSQAALISASIPASLDQVSNITSSYLNESMPGLSAGSIGSITHSVANSLISELPDALSLNREIPLSNSIDNVLSQNTYLASSLSPEQIQELSNILSQIYLSQVESVNTFPNSPSLIPSNTQGNPSDRKEERKLIPFSGRKYTPSVATMLFPGLNTEGITDINSPLLGLGIRPEPKYLNEESQEELGLRPRRLRSAVVYG